MSFRILTGDIAPDNNTNLFGDYKKLVIVIVEKGGDNPVKSSPVYLMLGDKGEKPYMRHVEEKEALELMQNAFIQKMEVANIR